MGLGRRRVGTRLELGPLQSRFLAFRAQSDAREDRCKAAGAIVTKINICKVKPSFRSWWLYETGRVTEVACWAHVRRPFYDVGVAGDSPRHRGARAHPATVRHRGGDPGSSSRGESGRRVQVKTAVSPSFPKNAKQVTSNGAQPRAAQRKGPSTLVLGPAFMRSLAVTCSGMACTPALPSAQGVFTSEFGMGSGGSRSLWPPGKPENSLPFLTLIARSPMLKDRSP